MDKVAILIDGGFYRRMAQKIWGDKTPEKRANELIDYCQRHLKHKGQERDKLYRIFYYDCPPMSKKVFHPLHNNTIDFEKTDLFSWMTQFLEELKGKRKVALRCGSLADSHACYIFKVRCC